MIAFFIQKCVWHLPNSLGMVMKQEEENWDLNDSSPNMRCDFEMGRGLDIAKQKPLKPQW